MAKIIIAGGSGMIGQQIEKLLIDQNHDVYILTRSPKKKNHIAWNPKLKSLDTTKIQGTNYLINLCGENIGSKRWTDKRKQELYSSRIDTNEFLFDQFHRLNSLKLFLSASGINCYPLKNQDKKWNETDVYGNDYVSSLVKEWEKSADLFSRIAPVCKVRISMVLDENDGALQKLLPLAKYGILSPMGDGKQWMNWVHINDVARAFVFAIENELDGAFNLTGEPVNNIDFTKALLKSQGKKLFFPKIPGFLLKLILGEQSTIVLNGVYGDNSLLKEKGFHYEFEEINKAFDNLFGPK
ncbi:MAG: TIGR01777 family oxidoreductase [Bacteroidota bacterium]